MISVSQYKDELVPDDAGADAFNGVVWLFLKLIDLILVNVSEVAEIVPELLRDVHVIAPNEDDVLIILVK